jgi:tRNA(Ile)-lysidine synthase
MTKVSQQSLLARITRPQKGKRFAAAVSGGCDSVAMLLLLRHWAKINQRELCVFHVDHRLRPESGADLKWVENLAGRLELDFYSVRATTQDLAARDQHDGTEAWARDFRYRAFARLSRQAHAEVVATGHTADDQLETVLMRMLSGTSLQGLVGIRATRSLVVEKQSLKIWRPVLNMNRQELEAYLCCRKQKWLTDQTNLSHDFLRNAVRHKLVPEVKKLFPGAGAKMQQLLGDIEEVQGLLSSQADSYLNENLVNDEKELVLASLSDSLRREVLRQWLIRLGFSREINRAFIVRLADLWQKQVRGRRVDHKNYCFYRHKTSIEFK